MTPSSRAADRFADRAVAVVAVAVVAVVAVVVAVVVAALQVFASFKATTTAEGGKQAESATIHFRAYRADAGNFVASGLPGARRLVGRFGRLICAARARLRLRLRARAPAGVCETCARARQSSVVCISKCRWWTSAAPAAFAFGARARRLR